MPLEAVCRKTLEVGKLGHHSLKSPLCSCVSITLPVSLPGEIFDIYPLDAWSKNEMFHFSQMPTEEQTRLQIGRAQRSCDFSPRVAHARARGLQGVVANTLKLFRTGAVGCMVWLDHPAK